MPDSGSDDGGKEEAAEGKTDRVNCMLGIYATGPAPFDVIVATKLFFLICADDSKDEDEPIGGTAMRQERHLQYTRDATRDFP